LYFILGFTGLVDDLIDGILKGIDDARNFGQCFGYLTEKLFGYLWAIFLYPFPELFELILRVKGIQTRICSKD
jgi:hypothetical protein